MSEARDGGCLRGRVRFRASGPSKWTIRRHCRSRRKHSGAPAAAFAACDETMVELTGAFDRPQSAAAEGRVLSGGAAALGLPQRRRRGRVVLAHAQALELLIRGAAAGGFPVRCRTSVRAALSSRVILSPSGWS